MEQAVSRRIVGRWVVAVAVAVFVVHACNYLYFFVDDEGIPLVYAQHLLHGEGLIYSRFEGPVEGYTDFLHVMLDTVLLAGIRAVHEPKVTVFLLGKAISLLAGVGAIVTAFLMIRRLGTGAAGAVAGLGFLALAGPLAVWSASSLETVPFTLLITLFAYALISAGDEVASRYDPVALGAGVLVALDRLDGLIFLAVIGISFYVAATPGRRHVIARRVALPILAVVAAYHLWRIWYFGDVLNTPLYTKVLYKLQPNNQRVVKGPDVAYWRRFVDVYGWPAFCVAGAIVGPGVWRERRVRAVVGACAILAIYAGTVGDWMFGFRFFVPLLPLAAVGLAVGCGSVARASRVAGWVAAAAIVAGSAVSARDFERAYEAAEGKPSWLRVPSLVPARVFGSYYDVYRLARRYVGPNDVIAYNQSGFVPFMLDVENIDDLGICSRFFAKMPDEDVFYTEVGRYAPLTAKNSIAAEDAYLLYRDAAYVIQRRDLVRKANGGRTPSELVAGRFTFLDAAGEDGDAIYRRSDRPRDEYARNPALFFENVAHVSYIRQAIVNGTPIAAADVVDRLPFLSEEVGSIQVDKRFVLDVDFSGTDVTANELDINYLRATAPAHLTIELFSARGDLRRTSSFDLADRAPGSWFETFPAPVQAGRLRLTITPAEGETVNVTVVDLRLQGQTARLANYIRSSLPFPRP